MELRELFNPQTTIYYQTWSLIVIWSWGRGSFSATNKLRRVDAVLVTEIDDAKRPRRRCGYPYPHFQIRRKLIKRLIDTLPVCATCYDTQMMVDAGPLRHKKLFSLLQTATPPRLRV